MNQPVTIDTPLITVITVVYNGALHLEDTIKSVLDLPYGNVRYIIIDGGSTDASVDIIKRYQERLAYWVSEPDAGIYDAMNKGWSAADDGSYILFLGAGDRILSLPKNMGKLRAVDVIYGKVYIGQEKCFTSKVGPLLKMFNTLHHQALLVKKSVHKERPFDLRFKVYADFDFNQRLSKQSARFLFADDLTGYALQGGVSDRFAFQEAFTIVRKNSGLLWAFCFVVLYAASSLWGRISPVKPFSALTPRR